MSNNLITTLAIDPKLTDRYVGCEIRRGYKKYVACCAAIDRWRQMKEDGDFPVKDVTKATITELFFGRSNWYNIDSTFNSVTNYPDMHNWLTRNTNISDADVWGVSKSNYSMKDLRVWFKEQKEQQSRSESESDSHSKKKGKEKAKTHKKKGKNPK